MANTNFHVAASEFLYLFFLSMNTPRDFWCHHLYYVYLSSQKEDLDALAMKIDSKKHQQRSLGYVVDTIVLIQLLLVHVFFIQKDVQYLKSFNNGGYNFSEKAV